jgi:hypothetical protein
MGKNIFDDLPLTLPRREPRPARREPQSERAEPQLFPASGVRSIAPPVGDAHVASPVGTSGHVPVLSPTPSAPDRLATGKPGLRTSTLAFLALVGLVAIGVIGASYGIGLSLLSGPARQTVAASDPKSAPLPAPISPDAGATHVTAAAAAIPDPPAALRPAAAAATAPPPVKAVQTAPPAVPSSVSLPPAVPAPKPAAIPAASPVAARDAAPAPPSPRKAASYHTAGHTAGHPPARHLQPEHARTASREARFRSARDDAAPAPRQSRLARSPIPPPDQTQSFDQLVSQLTRQTQPVDQSPPARQALPAGQFQDQTLTPPRPDQPDPFAGR